MEQILPGQPLRFSDDAKKALSRHLLDIVGALEDQHSPLLRNIEVWWDWYDAKPLVSRRTDPFVGASNIVVPLIRIHADSTIASKFNSIFAANDLWTARNRNQMQRPMVRSVLEAMNWMADDNVFDMQMPFLDTASEAVVAGQSVAMLSYGRRQRALFQPGEGGKPRAIQVEIDRGPQIHHVPREDVLWQIERELPDSEIIDRRSIMTWTDIVRMGQIPLDKGGWDRESIELIKGHTGEQTRAGRIRQSRLKAAGLTPDGHSAYDPYDIRETIIDYPFARALVPELPGEQDLNTPSAPIMVTWHRLTGHILRAISYPYLLPRKNYYEFTYRRRGRREHVDGLAKILHHMQEAMTTMANQAIDTVTLSNSILGITGDPELKSQKASPNRFLYSPQPRESFLPLNTAKLIAPDIALVNMVFGLSQRLTGINDPSLGQEIRHGGHPSPATSTLTLLQESRKLFVESNKHDRRVLSRLGEDTATLIQQFAMDWSTGRLSGLGDLDEEQVQRWLFPTDRPVATNIGFDLRAMSETLNPEEERNRALFVSQVTGNFYSQVFQLLQLRSQASQQGMQDIVELVPKAIRALDESYSRVLEGSQVDDIETFALQLQEAGNSGTADRLLSDFGGEVTERLRQVSPNGQGSPVPTSPTGFPTGIFGPTAGSGL